MARYTEAILDLAFRQGFERKRQRETEARRQARAKEIFRLYGEIGAKAQQVGPGLSGQPLAAEPPLEQAAQLASYGASVRGDYLQPRLDVSDMPWPDEVKKHYYNYGISFLEAHQFRDKTVEVGDKEIDTLLQVPQFAGNFPGNPEQGVTPKDHVKSTMAFFKAGFGEIGRASMATPGKPSALSEKLRYVKQFLTDPATGQARRWRGDLEDDPISLGQLKVLNLNYGDLSQIFNWDPAGYGKIESSVLEKLKTMDKINFGINFRRNLNKFREAYERSKTSKTKIVPEYVEDDDAKNLAIDQVFNDWFNPQTGELIVDKVIAEKERLDDIAAKALGYEDAAEITDDIREVTLQLGADGYKTVQDIDNLIQYYDSVGQYPPQHSREILEKVKQSIAAN